MGDRQRNESVSHALLALGIILLLIVSIIIAWIIVCCERCRRKRKYRPGKRRPDPLGMEGTITRVGPSPQIQRHLLLHNNPSDNLVIANKAFLSKSTPQLLENPEDEAWRFQGLSSTPCPSEPLIPQLSGSPQKKMMQIFSSSPFKRTKSEPLLLENLSFGSFEKDLSVHDQIRSILGTFPTLDYTSLLSPSKKISPKRLKEECDDGPESSVDDTNTNPNNTTINGHQEHEVLSVQVEVEVTPLSSGKKDVRPKTLDFKSPPILEETRYDFDVEKGTGRLGHDDEEEGLPPLMETTL